ncbi:MAG: Septum formation initiator [Verrucomicrobiota bacterium]|jgi:cell division protein FtsB
MNVIWDRLTKVVIFLFFVAGILGVFFWYLPLIQENQRYRRELLALDRDIADQERLGRQLRGSIEGMQNDPKVVERLAREKLGWARTNEMVIRFETPAPR